VLGANPNTEKMVGRLWETQKTPVALNATPKREVIVVSKHVEFGIQANVGDVNQALCIKWNCVEVTCLRSLTQRHPQSVFLGIPRLKRYLPTCDSLQGDLDRAKSMTSSVVELRRTISARPEVAHDLPAKAVGPRSKAGPSRITKLDIATLVGHFSLMSESTLMIR
jgi:hypothetical protein